MNGITFGVHLPIIRFDGDHKHSREQILSFAERAEKLGYDSLSVNDHITFKLRRWLDGICL
jgi:alkanesulfonate monooxygenase SsuD/methylene tetrahydromethanopterin reductase-like flavin-dependent oxidoreductase (luciferase family)